MEPAYAIKVNVENLAVGLTAGGSSIETAVSNIIGTLTIFGGIFMIIYLAYGALMYITSGGDKTQLEKARKVISNAVIGIVIIVLAASLAAVVETVLGVNILNPDWM